MQCEALRSATRILAIRLDNVGDVIMLSPALRAMKAALPDASITLMASPAGAQVAPLLPWVDDCWPVEAVWQDASGRMPLDRLREHRLIDDIRWRGFDAAFVFTSFSQSPYPPAYACYLAGVPMRVAESKEFGGGVLTHTAQPLPDETHQVDRNLHLLETAGVPAPHRSLQLCVPDVASDRANALLRARGIPEMGRFVAVAPGASCAARRYDAIRYAETIEMLHRDGVPVVLLGGPRERELTALIHDRSGRRSVDLSGATSVAEVAAVLARASLLIANDSGPMHIADAVGCPLVVLFSGTEQESQWAPRDVPALLLRRPTSCSPCYAFECDRNMECLDIPAYEVATAAHRLLRDAIPTRRTFDAAAVT